MKVFLACVLAGLLLPVSAGAGPLTVEQGQRAIQRDLPGTIDGCRLLRSGVRCRLTIGDEMVRVTATGRTCHRVRIWYPDFVDRRERAMVSAYRANGC